MLRVAAIKLVTQVTPEGFLYQQEVRACSDIFLEISHIVQRLMTVTLNIDTFVKKVRKLYQVNNIKK